MRLSEAKIENDRQCGQEIVLAQVKGRCSEIAAMLRMQKDMQTIAMVH